MIKDYVTQRFRNPSCGSHSTTHRHFKFHIEINIQTCPCLAFFSSPEFWDVMSHSSSYKCQSDRKLPCKIQISLYTQQSETSDAYFDRSLGLACFHVADLQKLVFSPNVFSIHCAETSRIPAPSFNGQFSPGCSVQRSPPTGRWRSPKIHPGMENPDRGPWRGVWKPFLECTSTRNI